MYRISNMIDLQYRNWYPDWAVAIPYTARWLPVCWYGTVRILNANPDLPAKEAIGLFVFRNCLRDKDEMVLFEAARAICNLPMPPPRCFSSSNSLAIVWVAASLFIVLPCALSQVAISEANVMKIWKHDPGFKSIYTTLAITTLLKTGGESSVDRLMKQISSFMLKLETNLKL